MTCVFTERLRTAMLCLALLVALGPRAVAESFEFAMPAQGARFAVDLSHGNLAAASLEGRTVAADCEDEYWLEGEDGSIAARSTEAEDEVLSVDRAGKRLVLRCRNAKVGVTVIKTYEAGPLPAALRKTVAVEPFPQRGVLHVFSRVRLGEALREQALLYTPRQSWGGKTLLFGVRQLSEITEPVTCSSGWDNRFVTAFGRDRTWSLAHWRSLVDGVWVAESGVIASWGKESPVALTYLPDGWRFRLLLCLEKEAASASADYVLERGDWYDAWAAYRRLPGYRGTYAHLDDMPQWCRKVKYGAFWAPPDYGSAAETMKRLCERLGDDAYVTVGIFGWSLDGDYETERPFMMETLGMVMAPDFFRRSVAALQEHPRVKAGPYIQGGLIDSVSQCYRDHPEWVIHGADGKPFNSGFADNAVGSMYMGSPRIEEWVSHHVARIRAVCEAYDCGYVYLDGGGYSELVDGLRRQHISFADKGRLNKRVFEAVRSTGRERGLLINRQNGPNADMSWLECGYFSPGQPWRDTVDFCFDTECQQDPRYTLEPLYWSDNDRYLAMCMCFGFTPCGDPSPEKPDETWRAIEMAWRMKPASLVLDSTATAPVWWRDEVPVVSFAERLGDEVVVPVLNFGEEPEVTLSVSLGAVGLVEDGPVEAEVYRPLLSAEMESLGRARPVEGRITLPVRVPPSWRGVTFVTLRGRA